MRRRLCRCLLRCSGWSLVGQRPPTGILVGAPHTSNWDFVLMWLVTGAFDVSYRFLIKKEWFRGPMGWPMRRLGGIPVDRTTSAALVRQLVTMLSGDTPTSLVIAAEGKRRKGQYWKSGFYRIAVRAQLPITLAFIDGPTRTAGFGPSWQPTGDVVADMDQVRQFYADKHGLRPAWRTEPRLREEATARGQ